MRKAADAIKRKDEQTAQNLIDHGIPAAAVRGQLRAGPLGNLPPGGNTGGGYTPDPDAVTRVSVRKNSTGSVVSRRRLNLIEGTGVTITLADDGANEEADITIAASGGGGGALNIDDGTTTVTGVTDLAINGATIVDDGGGAATLTIGGDVLPPSSGWSWVNQGTATLDTTGGIITITSVATMGDDIRAYVRTAPSVPYTITARIKHNLTAVSGAYCGLCWRESSSGKLVTFQLQTTTQMRIIRWTNPTTYGGAVDLDEAPPSWSLEWIRIGDDGTDRKVWISGDGRHWVLLHSIGRTTHLTANQVGIVANSASSSRDLSLSLLSWS